MSQAEFKKRLKVLMLRTENQICSDCPERQPRWASIIKPPPGAPPGTEPMGAFSCLECSGSHRRLGVHIAFVRSVNLDQWKEKEVLAMENGGNAKVNAIFEARLTVNKPTVSASGAVRERFIRDKYERRKFYDPNAFERADREEKAREQERVVSGVQRRLASSGSRKPSDAARKRVEERAARRGGSSVSSSSRSSRSVKTQAPTAPTPPAPAPAPPVDLLDFGDFESAEATSAVQASVGGGVKAAAPVAGEPQLDLFASMAIGENPGAEANGQAQQPQPGTPQQQQPTEQKRMSTADIMSMFNNPVAQQNPMQQNMFAMGGSMPNTMGGGMAGGNNMAMMGQQQMGQQQMGGSMNGNNMAMMNNMNQQQMAMMKNMQMMQRNSMMGQQGMGQMGGSMNNMGMMGGQGNMGGNGMMMQQQGQMPQMNGMMAANNGMMAANNGMMAANNGMMMQQQGQMPQMNGMMAANNGMMMTQGGGGMMQGGNQYGQPAMNGQAQPSPQKQQQFSEFGNFGR